MSFRTAAVILLVCLMAAVLEPLSSAPERVKLYRLLLFYPTVMIGSWILSRKNWSLDRRRVVLSLILVPAAAADLYVSSKIIAKLEFQIIFYLPKLLGYFVITTVVFGLVLAAEKIYTRLQETRGRQGNEMENSNDAAESD